MHVYKGGLSRLPRRSLKPVGGHRRRPLKVAGGGLSRSPTATLKGPLRFGWIYMGGAKRALSRAPSGHLSGLLSRAPSGHIPGTLRAPPIPHTVWLRAPLRAPAFPHQICDSLHFLHFSGTLRAPSGHPPGTSKPAYHLHPGTSHPIWDYIIYTQVGVWGGGGGSEPPPESIVGVAVPLMGWAMGIAKDKGFITLLPPVAFKGRFR
jgi:hypothetical protein